MTKRLVKLGVLRDHPLCLVDVGASGGIDEYWNIFGDSLLAFGFDGLVNEVERLNAINPKERRYFAYLVGSKDYQSPENVPTTEAFSRSTAARAAEITRCNYVATYFDQTGSGTYTTEVVELDEFFLKRHPADVDFIKVDTDGFDYQVLLGARKLLSSHRVLGVAIECQFQGLVHDEANTFRNIDRLLTGAGYSLFDIEVHRYSRAALPQQFRYRLPAQTERGQVLWADALYFLDAGRQKYESEWKVSFPADKIVKLACLYEVFGLEDCAVELLLKFRSLVDGSVDVGECLDLLTPTIGGQKLPYNQHMALFEQDPTSFYPPD